MREIRFRVWDKTNKKWIDTAEYFAFDVSGNVIGINNVNSVGREMSQYTGLKDKNGVLIYEGDIGKIVFDKIIPQYAICVAEWSEEYANISWVQKKLVNKENLSRGWAIHVKGFEVIGNIWEHKHLLENGK